ncbi:hypothetical protein RUND412_008421 [Rhizina undulata]
MVVKQRNRRISVGQKAVEAVKTAERKIEEALTCFWDDLRISISPFMLMSEYRKTNNCTHRPASSSFYKSCASLFYIHNETVNIYSHLLGAIFFILIGIYIHRTLPPRYPSSTPADILAFSTFFASAAICLSMSATYHTISNHSEAVAKFGNKLDYLGIVVLIVGSFVSSVYYGFYCHPALMWRYCIMITLLGIACSAVSIIPAFRTPKYRPFRASMFVGMGLSAILPVFHGLEVFGVEALQARMGLNWVLLQGSLYVLGAGIYAARMPERWTPGKYDLYGSSHQIFHFLVVAAACSHLVGLVKAFDYLHGIDGGVCL